MCGFQRQCHMFHEPSGPPCTNTTSGAGFAADAVGGRTSQPPSGVPSSAVALTRSTTPGATIPCSSTPFARWCGTWSAVRASNRTTRGGCAYDDWRAYTAVPSGVGQRSVTAPSAVSRVTVPSGRSTRYAEWLPSSSAVK